MTASRSLPDPALEPTISVERAGAILGVSRAQAYRLAATGQIPTLRLGRRRRVVPTARLILECDLAPGLTA